MNDILQQVADTVTNEPVIVTVDIKPQNRWDKIMTRIGIYPSVKVFTIGQIVLGNLTRISKLLTEIDASMFFIKDKKDYLQSNFMAMDMYGHKMAVIVAIALHNKKDFPPTSLVDFVETNFTGREILNVLSVVIRQMDVTSFMTTIISVGRINILESKGVSVISANGAAVSH